MSFGTATLLLASMSSAAAPGEKAEPKPRLHWVKNFDNALKKARQTGKPLMVDFWAPWCSWCSRLDKTTYVDPLVVRLAEDFIAVKVNTEGDPKEAALALRYDVATVPTIAFISPAGNMIYRVRGFEGPGRFPKSLEAARSVGARVVAWEETLERDASDAESLLGLGAHLFDQEDYPGSRALLQRAVKHDAGRPAPARKKARLLLAALLKSYDQSYPDAERLLKDALAIHPAGEEDPKLLYLLGKTYLAWGRRPEARAAFEQIVKSHAESPVAEKARETLLALNR
jgi:thioredoxin-like negative regulator of GroEL